MKRSPNFKSKLLKCNLNLNNLPNKQLKWWFNSKSKPKLPTKLKPYAPKIPTKPKAKEMKSMNSKISVKLISTRPFLF